MIKESNPKMLITTKPLGPPGQKHKLNYYREYWRLLERFTGDHWRLL